MHDFFYFGTALCNFLFAGVNISSISCFVFLCVGASFFSATGEGLRVARSHLSRSSPSLGPAIVVATEDGDDEEGREGRLTRAPSVQKLLDDAREGGGTHWDTRPVYHLFLSLLHTFHMTVGYILMLTVMTFNAYIFIAVLVGVGLGYFLFAPFDAMLTSRRNPYLSPLIEGGLSKVVRARKKCPKPACENVSSALEDGVPCSHCNSSDASAHDGGCSSLLQPPVAGGSTSHEWDKYSQVECASSDSLVEGVNAQLLLLPGAACPIKGDDENDSGDSDHEEHRTSDIAGLLSGQLTVDVHVVPSE